VEFNGKLRGVRRLAEGVEYEPMPKYAGGDYIKVEFADEVSGQ
jgi:hypothetical protein